MVSSIDWELAGALAVPLRMHGAIDSFVPALLECMRGWFEQTLAYTVRKMRATHGHTDAEVERVREALLGEGVDTMYVAVNRGEGALGALSERERDLVKFTLYGGEKIARGQSHIGLHYNGFGFVSHLFGFAFALQILPRVFDAMRGVSMVGDELVLSGLPHILMKPPKPKETYLPAHVDGGSYEAMLARCVRLIMADDGEPTVSRWVELHGMQSLVHVRGAGATAEGGGGHTTILGPMTVPRYCVLLTMISAERPHPSVVARLSAARRSGKCVWDQGPPSYCTVMYDPQCILVFNRVLLSLSSSAAPDAWEAWFERECPHGARTCAALRAEQAGEQFVGVGEMDIACDDADPGGYVALWPDGFVHGSRGMPSGESIVRVTVVVPTAPVERLGRPWCGDCVRGRCRWHGRQFLGGRAELLSARTARGMRRLDALAMLNSRCPDSWAAASAGDASMRAALALLRTDPPYNTGGTHVKVGLEVDDADVATGNGRIGDSSPFRRLYVTEETWRATKRALVDAGVVCSCAAGSPHAWSCALQRALRGGHFTRMFTVDHAVGGMIRDGKRVENRVAKGSFTARNCAELVGKYLVIHKGVGTGTESASQMLCVARLTKAGPPADMRAWLAAHHPAQLPYVDHDAPDKIALFFTGTVFFEPNTLLTPGKQGMVYLTQKGDPTALRSEEGFASITSAYEVALVEIDSMLMDGRVALRSLGEDDEEATSEAEEADEDEATRSTDEDEEIEGHEAEETEETEETVETDDDTDDETVDETDETGDADGTEEAEEADWADETEDATTSQDASDNGGAADPSPAPRHIWYHGDPARSHCFWVRTPVLTPTWDYQSLAASGCSNSRLVRENKGRSGLVSSVTYQCGGHDGHRFGARRPAGPSRPTSAHAPAYTGP